MDVKGMIERYRTPLHDIPLPKTQLALVVEPKWDGNWAMVVVKDGLAKVYSRTGRVLVIWPAPQVFDFVVLGEYIGNTHWACEHPEYGKVAVFDIVSWGSASFEYAPYSKRIDFIRSYFSVGITWINEHFVITPFMEINPAESDVPTMVTLLWQTWVIEQGYEGLVFWLPEHEFGMAQFRNKRTYTIDYVCVDIVEGGGRNTGRMGAIEGAVFVNSKLTYACSVGGGFSDAQRVEIWNNRDAYIGKVFEAYGMGLLGATLRHPQFGRWRDDKLPEECVG